MFNLFKKTKVPKPQTNVCNLNFILQTDGSIITELFWPDFTKDNAVLIDKIAQNFSSFLYLIMAGTINSDILETLAESKKQNKDKYDQEFISLTENYLSIYKTLSQSKSNIQSPVVPPSLVFKK
jgi:hypothetical protein